MGYRPNTQNPRPPTSFGRVEPEKTSIQALDRTQPSLPMRPGQIERRTHDYKRHGVTDLFAALNLATGQVVHQTRPQHRAIEFRKFLDLIDEYVPADLAVHVVLDNSRPFVWHKTADQILDNLKKYLTNL